MSFISHGSTHDLADTVAFEENQRVNDFARILGEWRGLVDPEMLRESLYQSHASYSRCGLGSRGTDDLWGR